MILVLAALIQSGFAQQGAAGPDRDVAQLQQITLAEALQRSVQLDPDYVEALGRIHDAEWGRRSAYLVFILPSITAQTNATKFSTEFFNIGTGQLASQIVDARLDINYALFRGGSKFSELSRTSAVLEAANANEIQQRFQVALLTESDYYDVVADRELTVVAQERVRRAQEQLAVARARVLTGAAVQTDSLQLLLELTRARVNLLGQTAALRVARLQLGRRVGVAGEVDAAPLDTALAPPLPFSEEEAANEVLVQSPGSILARADERAAEASYRSARRAYLPEVDLFVQLTAFDEKFFPSATTRAAYGLRVSLPIWNNAQREIALSRAATARDASRARHADTQLALRRDVIEAYEVYNTSRASTELAMSAVTVARENLRVQQERYRAGATTILDLITAQVDLSAAEAGLVQARQATRLALAGLEAILGRRIFRESQG